MSNSKTKCIKAATKPPSSELSVDQVTSALFDAISCVMMWMPEEERSKAILVADPRDETKLIAIHTDDKGTWILQDEAYQDLISNLCSDCVAKLKPYSIIYTGIDCNTGKPDPEAFVGLAGGHDEEVWVIDIDEDGDEEKPPTLN